MIKRAYNKIGADRLLKEYVDLTGMDYQSTLRNPRDAYLRALFYNVLKRCNDMNDRMVKEFYADKGVKRDRSSIYHSVSKVDIYYLNYKEFRMFYDSYFDDKKDDYLEKKDIKIEAEVLKNTSTRLSKEDYIELQNYRTRDITQKDLLDKLIEGLPEDKRVDIYDMVNLRVKSWDWKSKNEYEIIESTEGLSGRAY